jgi:uncharacterized protein (TIGR02118 family)
VAKLVILYGHPAAPAAFEVYYANQHIPYAGEHMPNVRATENMRVISAADGSPAPYYRISQLSYYSVEDLRAGTASRDGRSTIANLANFATGGATLLIAGKTSERAPGSGEARQPGRPR